MGTSLQRTLLVGYDEHATRSRARIQSLFSQISEQNGDVHQFGDVQPGPHRSSVAERANAVWTVTDIGTELVRFRR